METPLDIINKVLETFTGAAEATDAVSNGWKGLQKLLKPAQAAADADVKATIAELTRQIADAHIANAKLKIELVALREAIAQAERFESDLDRYELWKAPAGVVVYRLRDAEGRNEPAHLLCPHCVEAKRKSILQGDRHYKRCHPCGATFPLDRADRNSSGSQAGYNPLEGY